MKLRLNTTLRAALIAAVSTFALTSNATAATGTQTFGDTVTLKRGAEVFTGLYVKKDMTTGTATSNTLSLDNAVNIYGGNFFAKDFTISIWVDSASLSSSHLLFAYGNNTNPTAGYQANGLYWDATSKVLTLGDGQVTDGYTTFNFQDDNRKIITTINDMPTSGMVNITLSVHGATQHQEGTVYVNGGATGYAMQTTGGEAFYNGNMNGNSDPMGLYVASGITYGNISVIDSALSNQSDIYALMGVSTTKPEAAMDYVWKGSTSDVWDTTTTNWVTKTDGTTPTKYVASEDNTVTFDSTGNKKTVTLSVDTTIGSVTVDGAAYTLDLGSHTLTTGPLAVKGEGSLALTGEGTVQAKSISAAGKTINIGEKVVLQGGSGATVTLEGAGTYVLPTGVFTKGDLTYGENWTGAVLVANQTHQDGNSTWISNLGSEKSWVEFSNFTGYDSSWAGTVTANIKLTKDADSNIAWNLTAYASQWKTMTNTGKWKGDGTFRTQGGTSAQKQAIEFAGDISEWTGEFQAGCTGERKVIFSNSATVVNAGIVKIDGASTFTVEVQTGTSFNAAVTADQMIVNAADKTATLAGTATLGSVAIDAGTLSLGAENLVLGNVNVADGATLAAADDSSATAIITFNPNSALSVGEDGLVLNSGSTLTFALDGGKVNFSTSATAGSDNIIVATGFASQDDTGVTFDGKGIANAADYFALGTTLSSYTQLKYKDGALLLAREFSANYWGKDQGDGDWDFTAANWSTSEGGEASIPFTDGLDACFTASGAGGTITVGESINVAILKVSGASYTFVNADSLSIAGGINVTESGSAVFDKLAAGELPVIGIGSGSSMTVSGGNVEVQTLANEGALTVANGDLTIKTAVTKGGNVTADNMILATGENTFASVNVSGGVNGASHLKTGGTSTIGLLGGVNALTLTDGSLSLGGAIGLETTNLNGALTAGAGLSLGAVTMSAGSSIQSTGAVTATGITVNGTANIGGTTTLQTGTVAGGTLKVNSGSTVSIAGGKTTTVSGTLEMLSGSTMDNQGMLSVSGRVIAADGNALGMVNATGTGTIEVNGAVSAAGGSIANLDMGAGDSLDVAQNLALTNTTGDAGTLTVDGILTVNGAVALTNVTAGSLVMGATDGKLTATGTLTAGTITLGRVSKTDSYITAGELATTTTNFVVDEDLVKGLGAKQGTTITLADLDTTYTGTQLLVNNAPSFMDTETFLVYTIMQDSDSHDIVLFVDEQESGFVWTGGEDTLWSHGGNWSGGSVPGETDRVQVKNDTNPHEMELDEDAHISHISVSADDATLRGDHTLLIDDALEVSIGGALTVGDGSSETMVSAPSVQVSGELNVQDNAFVDSRQTSITVGALSVAPQGAYFTGVMDMTEGASLYVAYGASLAAEQLNGDLDSTVGGRVTVYGNGGRYTGGYDNACIDIVEGADATLYAGEGLTLAGDGTAKLQYSGNAAIAGVDADALTIILNNPSVSNIGSTLTLQQASRLGNGSVQFGMSALDSAKTIGSGAPVILQGDLSLGDGAAVVVNQDSADAGVALDVRNGGSTRNLVLARFGGANTNTRNVTLTGYLYGKYYRNARIENGALLVDLRDDFYRTVSGAHTPNGIAGGRMVDAAFVERNPQATNPNGDLAAVMTALETGAVAGEAADKTLAAMSGASIAAMGAAFGADVDRQLRAIRNRTTTMGLSDCLVNEELPYFNAWVNAEGDYRKLNADNPLAGYKLSSWGGTVGFDVDCTPRFTCGVALTAMQGNFTANSAEAAEGDLDRLYVSAFARYTRHALSQTLVATFGRADAKLHRTVNYGAGAYRTDADTNGTAFGVMYEIGYAKALNEDATTCLQPVLNLSYRHSALDGFNEKGLSDAALTAGDAEMNVFTAAIGARLQSVVGTSVYNRSSLFEGRVMLKLDSGDRDVAVRNHFVGIAGGADAKSAEVGAFGVEIGAGITLPIAEDGGSLFFDVTGEFRSGYSEVNGTVGYRFNF